MIRRVTWDGGGRLKVFCSITSIQNLVNFRNTELICTTGITVDELGPLSKLGCPAVAKAARLCNILHYPNLPGKRYCTIGIKFMRMIPTGECLCDDIR